jgi:hypothetical protein
MRSLRQALSGGAGPRSGARLLATAAYLTQALPLALLGLAVRLADVFPTRDLPLAWLAIPPVLAQALAWHLARRDRGARAQAALLLVSGPVAAAAVAAVALAVEPGLNDAALLGLLSLTLLVLVLLAA